MSGIVQPGWWRSRGGIYDSRGRIVPARVGQDPSVFPGEGDRPSSATLWGLWNAYRQQTNGDIYTPSGDYDLLADMSGNGRDVEPFTPANTPSASAATFPGEQYTISVPLCTGGTALSYVISADRIDSFTFVLLSPYNGTRSTTESEWRLISSFFGDLWAMRRGTSGLDITYQNYFANVGTFGPVYTIPDGTVNQSQDAWMLQATRCSVSGSTATWRSLVAYDFGSGPALAGDNIFSETATLSGSADTSRSDWRGVNNGGAGEKPLCSVYTGALSDDDFVAAALAAVAQRDASAVSTVRGLIS